MDVMKRPALLVLAAVSVALAGCGGSGGKPKATVPPGITVGGVRVAQVFVVHETESRLTPRRILVPRLGYYAIKAVNDGKVTHALELTGPGLVKKTSDIPPGGSAKFAVFFKRSGTYKLFSPTGADRAKGMQATVRVP
jgi:hypothetical protein